VYWLSKLYTWISRWGINEEEKEEEEQEEDDDNNEVTNLYLSSYVTAVNTTNIIEAENVSLLEKRKYINNFGKNT